MLKPGAVYTFRLENGAYGACRVLRGPESRNDEKERFKGRVLVHATKWVGELPLDLKHADLRKTSRGRMGGSNIFWMKGKPPTSFQMAGTVSVRAAEKSKSSNSLGPWSMFPNAVFAAWEMEHKPVTSTKKQDAAKAKTKKTRSQLLKELVANEKIDLTKFVPLAKPKTEREPQEVLKGFIAAMNQWEKECARIEKKSEPASPVEEFSRGALQQIFAEFCTPKPRKYGRLGSFRIPPEYNPRSEKILAIRKISKIRVEIDSAEKSGLKRELTYVLLRKKKCWLIDSKRTDNQRLTL